MTTVGLVDTLALAMMGRDIAERGLHRRQRFQLCLPQKRVKHRPIGR